MLVAGSCRQVRPQPYPTVGDAQADICSPPIWLSKTATCAGYPRSRRATKATRVTVDPDQPNPRKNSVSPHRADCAQRASPVHPSENRRPGSQHDLRLREAINGHAVGRQLVRTAPCAPASFQSPSPIMTRRSILGTGRHRLEGLHRRATPNRRSHRSSVGSLTTRCPLSFPRARRDWEIPLAARKPSPLRRALPRQVTLAWTGTFHQ